VRYISRELQSDIVQVHGNKDQQVRHEHNDQENRVIYVAGRDEKAIPCVTMRHHHVVNEDQGHHQNDSDEDGGLPPNEKACLQASKPQG
jgi:hypothetical protein